MKYINTLCINCDMSVSGKEIATLNSSHVIRMDQSNYHAYCVFISLFGEVFYTAQQLQSEGILDGPYKVAVVIPKIESFKNSEPEDNLARMKFILNKFVPPEKGIAISFYEHWQEKKVIKPFGAFYVWPYKEQWNKDNCEDYVCVQSIDEIVGNVRYADIEKVYERLLKFLNTRGISYKVVGYKQPIEDMYNMLLKCKLLLSYTGTSLYIAGGLNLPTLAFGNDLHSVTDDYINRKLMGSKNLVPVLTTVWGEWCIHNGKIIHYNKQNGLHNRPQSNTINIGKVETERDYEILRNALY